MEPDVRLWIHAALDYEFDAGAECPVWQWWLGEVFPGDVETQECIEEELGYEMTNDVRFRKGFLHIGEQGDEGKSTLAALTEALVGSAVYMPLEISTWMKGEFWGEAMIGKKVGVFADLRLKEPKWYGQSLDPGGIDHASKGLMLKISGGDPLPVRRKYRGEWHGRLPMKLRLISNMVPSFNDPILPSRFIKIAYNVSFKDRKDINMIDKLKAELPGIANRCLRAYRRLCGRGGFIQPKSGLVLERKVAARSNAYQAFIDDCYVTGEQGALAMCVVVYRAP
jgi:putative DNA primase/helicase